MRAYAYVVPTFWTRGSGKRLRGNPAAQALALYVMTAPSSNMIGLYYVPATTIASETGIPIDELPGVFTDIREIAKYDFENEVLWVPEGAAHQIGDEMKGGDKRRKLILRELEAMGNHPFVSEFMDRYADAYGLESSNRASETKGHIERQEGASTNVDESPPCPDPVPAPDPAVKQPSNPVSGVMPVAEPKKQRRKSPDSAMPDPFPLTDKHLRHATEKGWPIWWMKIVHEAFCGKARAKGWRYVQWDAALYDFAHGEIGYRRGPADLAHLAPKGDGVTPAAPTALQRRLAAEEAREVADLTKRAQEATSGAALPPVNELLKGIG